MQLKDVQPTTRPGQHRTSIFVFRLTLFVFWAIFAVFLFFTQTTNAADIPNLDKPVDFNVREQNVNEFLNALFQEINVPLSINTSIEGNINGQFNNAAGEVLNEIAGAFDLLVYYDGAVAQAYRNNQITRRLLPVNSSRANKVLNIASRMKLPDVKNTVSLEDSGLLVSGTDRFIVQIEEIIDSVKRQPVAKPKSKLKAAKKTVPSGISFPEETPIVYQTFKLKHAWAVDTSFPVGGKTVTIPGVATILGQLLLSSDQPLAVEPAVSSSRYPSGLKGQGLSNSRQPGLKTQTVAPSTLGVPRIVADSRLNALIIKDYEDKMPAYKRLIDSLDVESGMVEIEATIIDINTDKTRDLGINWRYQGSDGAVQFGSGGASDRALTSGGGDLAQGRGGVLSLMLGEPADFLTRVRLLEEKGAARVVSKPHVITLSDVEAVLAATTEFFVRVAGDEEVDLFNVPVGTTLRVTPHVFTDNYVNKIKLLVNIEDGSQSQGVQVDSIPVIERANISTQAVINEGDSLLVGGLVRESYRNSGYQVPVLGSIPLIGGLFQSKQKQATRMERLFLITPRLANGAGFGGGSKPALAGTQSQIVNDASKRIRMAQFNDRPAITYWSENSRTASDNYQQRTSEDVQQGAISVHLPDVKEIPASKSLVNTLPVDVDRNTQQGSVDPANNEYAIIENNVFKSPFSVEPW